MSPNEMYLSFFETSPVPFAIFAIEDHFTTRFEFVNDAYLRFTELKREDVIGRRLTEVFPGFDASKKAQLAELLLGYIEKRVVFVDFLHDIVDKWVRVAAFPLEGNRLAVIILDNSSEYLLRDEVDGFLNVNADLLCVSDREGRFLKINKSFETMLGKTIEELRGWTFLEFLHPDDVDATRKALSELTPEKPLIAFPNRYRTLDGSFRHFEWNAMTNGKIIYASAHDVTVSVLANERLEHDAQIDPLTGLFNRNYFYKKVAEEMDFVNRTPGSHLALVLVDIDFFKRVNDTWGHPIGDDVLERVSRLLADGIRKTDSVARIGGEEFIILMPKTSIEQARISAERLRIELAMTRMPIVGTVTASFGVAEMEPKESFRSFYNRVDNAMYKAKDNGRNMVAVVDFDEAGVIADAHRYFEWRKEWESGNPVIDGEHRQLISHCNRLAQALQVGGEWSKTLDVLAVIYAQTDAHFASEEKILRAIGYPDLETHANIHRAILRTAKRLIDDFAAGAAKPSVLVSFLIDDFIIGHLLEEDVKYFPHIAEKHDAELASSAS